MKALLLAWGLGLALVLPGLGEETSAGRLENAQTGVAEGSWPRKPDNRLSPLSGKMKESREISVGFYGKEKEIPAKSAEISQRQAPLGQKAPWQGAMGQNWEEVRWNQGQDHAADVSKNTKFQLNDELASRKITTHRELDREPATDWSSRSARLKGGRSDPLPMYEGRLTRVRQQVWQEEPNPRELGPGRQEKFSPEEVEKMLSRPVEELRGTVKEQSPEAFPLATADN